MFKLLLISNLLLIFLIFIAILDIKKENINEKLFMKNFFDDNGYNFLIENDTPLILIKEIYSFCLEQGYHTGTLENIKQFINEELKNYEKEKI